MPTADYELPYDGAKEMLLVEDVENKEFLKQLLEAMYEELPAPKARKKKHEWRKLCWLIYQCAEDIPRRLS